MRAAVINQQRAIFLMTVIVLFITVTANAASKNKKQPPPLELEKPVTMVPWVRYAEWPDINAKDYNTLNATNSPAYALPPKIEGSQVGDPKKGEALAFNSSRGGSCSACHVLGQSTPTMPGNVGPDLSTIGNWGRSDEWLFNYIYDSRSVNPMSVMPPWGAHKMLSIDEIKDVVAFLQSLKESSKFTDEREDPATRSIPLETRDNLDLFTNNGIYAWEEGKALLSLPGTNGKSCVSCHAKVEQSFKTWAATMPRYEPRLNKVLGVEEFVTRHARATTGANYLLQSWGNLSLSVFLRSLANGERIRVDLTSPEAKRAYERGLVLMDRKIGQLNFACTDCHQKAANRWIRGQYLTEHLGQIAHFPTWRTSRAEVWDIRKRFQWCNVAVRANELPPDAPEYGDLELALTALNNGQKVSVPGIRQ